MEVVRILDSAVDQSEDGTIIRGRIDPKSLRHLKAGKYQRQVMPDKHIEQIQQGFLAGSVPDVILGMRGNDYLFEEMPSEGLVITLTDPVYIVDGLQRVTAALRLHREKGVPRLGAAIHLGSTEDWEVEMFKTLNANRTKVSPNVLLRNMQGISPVIRRLYKMSTDPGKTHVISGRITWNQYAQVGELITALVLVRVIASLHRHLGQKGLGSTNFSELVPALEELASTMGGEDVLFANVSYFFNLIDECWTINGLLHKGSASQIKGSFLMILARVFSDHLDFWRKEDKELFLDADTRRKLAALKINTNSDLARLASASGKSKEILYAHLVHHLNRGRRTNIMRARPGAMIRLSVVDTQSQSA